MTQLVFALSMFTFALVASLPELSYALSQQKARR
jgi:hypothetical protein